MEPDAIINATAIAFLLITKFNRCSSSKSTRSSSKSDAASTYLTVVFWHSIVVTSSTPLLRLIYNRWYGHTPLHWLFSTYLAIPYSASIPSYFAYPTPADSPRIDTAFFLHSLFSLLWVVVGHITLLYSHRWTLQAHRRMGYVAIASFVLHVLGSLYTLLVDVVRHHPLPRTMLLLNSAMTSRFMLGAVAAARRGNMRDHRALMLRVYLYSTEGAGTVRQAEHLMWMLRGGSALCQQRNGSFTTTCVWPYMGRLTLTRLLTLYHLAIVAKLRADDELYRSVVREVRGFLCAAGGLCAMAYAVGLEQTRELLQAGGYLVLVSIELFLPKPGVEGLAGMHSMIGRRIVVR